MRCLPASVTDRRRWLLTITVLARQIAKTLSGRADLTAREREIAVLAARGLPNKQIAEQLVVSIRTVESHLLNACHKLHQSPRRRERGQHLGRGRRSARLFRRGPAS